MTREWRSDAWKMDHPLSFSAKFKDIFFRLFTPLRKFIGKIALPNSSRYIDVAARWKVWHKIDGDYCEFGVYTGRQFTYAYKALARISRDGRFYAFDSFNGLPKPEGVDLVYPQFSQGGLAATREEFMANLKKHNVDISRVNVVEGWYSDVLNDSLPPKIGLSNVAIALVDCDLYGSTILVLDFLTNLLVDGAIIIFDDWFLFRGHPDLGSQKAFCEWAAKNPNFRFSSLPSIPDSFQKAFIVHKPLPK